MNIQNNYAYCHHAQKTLSFAKNQNVINIPFDNNDDFYNQIHIYSDDNAKKIPNNYFAPIHKPTEIDIRNRQLEEKYGIKSDIKSLKLLDRIEKSIEDFCEINNDRNLFKKNKCRLIISESPLNDNNTLFQPIITPEDNEFEIVYNANYNIDKLTDNTNIMYDFGNLGANNPNYLFYKSLGNFLEFSNNPQMYTANINNPPLLFDNLTERQKNKLLKVAACHKNFINDWKANYIASKMSGQYLPKWCDDNFKSLAGNTNLKFPQSQYPVSKYRSNFNFSSINEAEQYLNKKYKITAQFNNLDYANACVNAVEALTKAIGNKNAFKDLEIVTTTDDYSPDSNEVARVANFSNNYREKKLYINAYKNASDSDYSKSYDAGASANKSLNGLFTHELAHILDKNFNDKIEYATISREGLSFNEQGKTMVSKVSAYACDNPAEFLAEYVAGRMDGHKYPQGVNALFNVLWGGPKINFP